jgi:hypothetical protein
VIHISYPPGGGGGGTAGAPPAAVTVAAAGARNGTRYDYQCDGTADEVEIAAAVAALPAGGGVVLLSEGTFNLAAGVAVGVSGAMFRGAGPRATVLNQTTYGLPCLEVRAADDVTVEGFKFLSAQTKAVINTSYDGRPARDRAAGVYAANSHRTAVRGCSFQGLVVGIKLRGDTTANTTLNNHSSVRDCFFTGVDYGVLFEQQDGLVLSDLRATATENSQPSAPPHLVYGTGPTSAPFSRNRNVACTNGTANGNAFASPYKFKFTDGLVLSNCTADNCERGFDIEDCDDAVVSNCTVRDLTAASGATGGADSQQAAFGVVDCDRTVLTGCHANVSGQDSSPGFYVRYSFPDQSTGLQQCNDVLVTECSVQASYTAANTRGGFTVEGGTRVSLDGCAFTTTGDSTQPAFLVRQLGSPLTGSTDCSVVLPRVKGTSVPVKVNSVNETGTRVFLNTDLCLTGNTVTDNGTGTKVLKVSGASAAAGSYVPDQPAAHGLVEWNYDPVAAASASALVSGTLYLLRFVAQAGGTVANVYANLSTLGATLTAALTAAITNIVNNGAGLCRVTATAHGYVTNDVVTIAGVVGATQANGASVITVIDANTFDLVGSSAPAAYVSGGTATRSGNCIALYDAAGAFLTATGDQVATWTGTTGLKAHALAKAVTLAAGTAYYVALLGVGTTPASFSRAVGVSLAAANESGAGLRFAANGTGLAKLPAAVAPASGTVTGAFSFWAALG